MDTTCGYVETQQECASRGDLGELRSRILVKPASGRGQGRSLHITGTTSIALGCNYSYGTYLTAVAESIRVKRTLCGHCKKLKPEYAKAAGLIKGNDPPIALAKVDCTEAGKETCNKHGVTGYPTLKIFRGGEVSQEYNGPREAAGIVKHMKSQVGPSSKDLNKDSELEEFINKEDVAVVGFFEKESDLKSAFLKVADALREKVRFGHTSNRDLLSKHGHT
uniref:protein disulfide-isomerase n=1 Tax=Timema californicum TaxID=61474 RepID=A0A7R9PDT2_TIMCA|nr:unnamed protein product [Timema californicum]